jgi:ATP/maltotriose-dependent transcriptional regulator MalT
MWGPTPLRAYEQLITGAAALGPRDAALASAMLADAAQAAIAGGEPGRALAASRRARRLAHTVGGRTEDLAEVHHLVMRLATGGRRPAGRSTWASIDRLPVTGSPGALEILLQGATALYWTEDYDAARRLLERVVERARGTRSLIVATALDTLAAVLYRLGDWPAADGLSAEALRIAGDRGVTFDTASAATTLARIAAARGNEADCRALLDRARKLAPRGSLTAAYAASAAGLLELSLGRTDAAIRALEPLASARAGKNLSPIVNQWLPELIESYVRAGRASEALPAIATLEAAARTARGSLTQALATRSRGLLAPAATFDLHFEEALRLHARTTVPFERARTELCYGERLRRARRRSEAVPHLRSALATFERIGAAPWADRARRELGPLHRSARGAAGVTGLLTSHELAVASLVRRGATNREAASALFVTPKTVEYHLAAIYRKLGVRSRTELAIALIGAETGRQA